jgi:hypothetical protein
VHVTTQLARRGLRATSGCHTRSGCLIQIGIVPIKPPDLAIRLDQGYRIDLLVEQQVIVEIKVVERIASVHEAQVLSYLKLSGCRIGLLLNFNVKLLKNGIRRLNYMISLCNSVASLCISV